MVEHIVLVKWKVTADPAKIAEVQEATIALKDKIPGIIDVAFGEDFMKARSLEFTHGLVMRMDKKETVKVYEQHPEHIKVLKKMIPLAEKFLSIDFESPRHVSRL
ncbi:hypothetical protein AC1031_011022 [Aphanomyces cochlioides]|nr:hypothetical protein AC1031_011022 [Aphanomyces cochlioides]